MQKQICLLLVFTQLLACSSTTLIRSSDPGAKIYVDGEYKGRGSFSYSDTKIIGTENSVRLEKEGCAPVFYSFSRNERLDWLPLIFIWTIVPAFWVEQYDREHLFEYNCEKRAYLSIPSPVAVR